MSPIAKFMLLLIALGVAIWLVIAIVFVISLFTSAIALPVPVH